MLKKLLIADTDKVQAAFAANAALGCGFTVKAVSGYGEDLKSLVEDFGPGTVILGGEYLSEAENIAKLMPQESIYLFKNDDSNPQCIGSPIDMTSFTDILDGKAGGGGFRHRGITVDTENCRVITDKGSFNLTLNEMNVLRCFLSNPNRVFNTAQLAYEVFGTDEGDCERMAGTAVATLKSKLDGKCANWNLKMLWGVGYKFEIVGE